MQKAMIISAISAAVVLATMSTQAADDMEKCEVTINGKGLIKEKKSDCRGIDHSCAGQNKAGDPISYILVPKGMCAKINAGDISDVPQNILDKIEIDQLPKRN